MYKVIEHFTDLQDSDHPYNVGDTFPRDGFQVTRNRLAELSGSGNRRGMPLIVYVEDEKPAAKRNVKKPADSAGK